MPQKIGSGISLGQVANKISVLYLWVLWVLLRFCDQLKVLRPNIQPILVNSACSKELEFLHNATTSTIQDLLSHTFRNHISQGKASR